MLARRAFLLLGTLVLLASVSLLFKTQFFQEQFAVLAAPQAEGNNQSSDTGGDPNLSIGNDTCLACHGQPGQSITLENGEILDLYINPDDFAHSIHGQKGYACVQCHTTVGNYPHPPFQAASLRDVTLKLYQACQYCHISQYQKAQDSVHATALASGQTQAAVCTDCHTAHETRQLTDPDTHKLLLSSRVWIPQTCAKCHSAIYNEYKDSVHGAALLEDNNTDVPTCIDCHGVHNIVDPTTARFRLLSPQICAKCHTNPALMAKYGISTNVLNTYVADFHGTTVTIFQKESPDAPTNKAVCYDCHGIHDISRPNDPVNGIQANKEKLLARCRTCHPDADANFPSAWMSHYIPSPDKYPIVYYVNLFYKFFIPGVLGGMAMLVAMDVGRTFYNRSKRSHPAPEQKPLPEPPPAAVQEEAVEITPETLPQSPSEAGPEGPEPQQDKSVGPSSETLPQPPVDTSPEPPQGQPTEDSPDPSQQNPPVAGEEEKHE